MERTPRDRESSRTCMRTSDDRSSIGLRSAVNSSSPLGDADPFAVPLVGPASLVEFAIKAQVFALERLDDIDDLPVVQSEVLHHVVHGLQPRDVISLNVQWRDQV